MRETETAGGNGDGSGYSNRGPVAWKDARFQPAIDSVRAKCGFSSSMDREDDPMIGMCATVSTSLFVG